jgi:hypothetical protein
MLITLFSTYLYHKVWYVNPYLSLYYDHVPVYFFVLQIYIYIYSEVDISIWQSLNSCLQDVPAPAPHILQLILFCGLNIGIISLLLLCNSPEEHSSQDDFSHKNNTKNISNSTALLLQAWTGLQGG